MILPLYVALEKIDPRLIEAASDLYAGRWAAFRRVTLPLALPGVFAGSLLTFIPAMGDYINAELLGTPQTRMIGNVIQNRLLIQNDYPVGSALSFILMAAILVAVGDLRPPPGHRAADRLMTTTPSPSSDTPAGRPPPADLAADRRLPAAAVHGARHRLPADPDRGHDRVLVQQAGGQVQLRLERVLARWLDAPAGLAGPGRRRPASASRSPCCPRSSPRSSGR